MFMNVTYIQPILIFVGEGMSLSLGGAPHITWVCSRLAQKYKNGFRSGLQQQKC
jgi:hypothetical protein